MVRSGLFSLKLNLDPFFLLLTIGKKKLEKLCCRV